LYSEPSLWLTQTVIVAPLEEASAYAPPAAISAAAAAIVDAD
jgi:hypothetical protein